MTNDGSFHQKFILISILKTNRRWSEYVDQVNVLSGSNNKRQKFLFGEYLVNVFALLFLFCFQNKNKKHLKQSLT